MTWIIGYPALRYSLTKFLIWGTALSVPGISAGAPSKAKSRWTSITNNAECAMSGAMYRFIISNAPEEVVCRLTIYAMLQILCFETLHIVVGALCLSFIIIQHNLIL